VQEYEHLFNKAWNILEIGCGEGKNPIYLASKGFTNINAFDLSENGIAKLSRTASKNSLLINAWVQDLREFKFEKHYDLIISFGTLHFVEKRDWKSLLSRAKENTNFGGIHIIQIFTNSVPASPDIAPFAIGLANDKELENLYAGWDILESKSYTFEDEHPGARKHIHAADRIVARCNV
jgi:cyclopropane fatty-acyl-phospholipid synthase-like methyltransferase